MAIPNVQVNVEELNLAGQNRLVPFIPAVILKTKSGPIGTVERVTSVSDFVAKFGTPDTTTPAAYALQKYLQAYQYAYVTRVANKSEAAEGKATLKFTSDREVENAIVAVPAQSASILGKNVSALVNTGMKVLEDGSVKGTFLQVSGYTDYSTTAADQSGYFFPFKLQGITGEELVIKKNGVVARTSEDVTGNQVIKVSQADIVDIVVDETTIATLNFAMSTFTGTADPITDAISLDLIEVATKYKTDLVNGKTVSLVYDATNSKIYIDLTNIVGRNTTTIKEDIDISTITAAEYNQEGELVGGLEYILNKLVTSANAITKLPVTVVNKFTNKTASDAVPTTEQFAAGFTAYIQGGNSGNGVDVSDEDVLDLIDLYHYQDYPIDELVIPEYRSYTVVNYAVEQGRINYYRVIAQATGNTVEDMKTSVQNYVQDKRGFLDIYTNDVTYNDFVDAEGNAVACPVSVAVLNAYAYANYQNAWCTIAGVNRGTLNQIDGLALSLSKSDMDELYENIIPINTINYISSVGYVVWGNKTSANAEDTKMFDRINVSRLINYMNRQLITVGWEYMFEPITLSLFTEFKGALDGVCQTILEQEGIDDYVVVCNSSNNTEETIAKNELHALIQVKPTQALEYVIIDLTATDTITINIDEAEEV